MVFKTEIVTWGLKTTWYFAELPDGVSQILALSNKKKFDGIVMPLFPIKAQRTGSIDDFMNDSFIASELLLSNGQVEKITIRLSALDICDPAVRKKNRSLLKQEVEYCAYLGVPKIIIPIIPSENAAHKYSSFIKKLKDKNFLNTRQIVLEVPAKGSWQLYNQIRILSNSNYPISLILQKELPNKNDCRRWISENLMFIQLTTDLFQMNDKGAPILTESHAQLLTSVFPHEPYISIQGPTPKYELTEHRNYLIHLFKQQEPLTDSGAASQDFNDVLQYPLQPYKDNLSSSTYDCFEHDQIKYDLYEEACRQYFRKDKQKHYQVLMAGAGRGGILDRVILAAQDVHATIIALEKNPYAYLSLQYLKKQRKHWNKVIIVLGDLKTWQYEHKFDLVVSELLGSFGDNELSPECLEWGQRLLAEDAVSIPKNSVSYLVPISCPLLHHTVKGQFGEKGYQQTYVVQFHKYYTIPDIQECFTFNHPGKNELNMKKTLSFTYKQDNLIHGFAGYFLSVLYNEIKMSTHPITHTPDMYSWFPLYLPLNTPIFVQKNQTILLTIERLNNEEYVWYQWKVVHLENDQMISESIIHNENGVQQKIYIK